MTISIDTNICVSVLRGDLRLRQRLTAYDPAELALSSIVHFELMTGESKLRDAGRAGRNLAMVLGHLVVLDFSRQDAEAAAEVRAYLERAGRGIGPLDTLIAGQALARGLTVATNNVREFSRVPGLKVEDWLAPL